MPNVHCRRYNRHPHARWCSRCTYNGKNARQAEEVLLVFEEDEDVYEPDDSDIQRVDATSDSEEVDMEHGESDINDISNVRSQIASTTAMPAQSQSDLRVLRRSTRKST